MIMVKYSETKQIDELQPWVVFFVFLQMKGLVLYSSGQVVIGKIKNNISEC